jgi:hypothetical protein
MCGDSIEVEQTEKPAPISGADLALGVAAPSTVRDLTGMLRST